MNEELIFTLGREALKTSAYVAAPMLIGSLIIGLIVSVFQAITQINEATLTFIPKIVIVGIMLIVVGPWMVDQLTAFTSNLLMNIADMVRY